MARHFYDEDINQRDLLFQCPGCLERIARKAEESGNYSCVIGAVAQMNKMMALGADQEVSKVLDFRPGNVEVP